MSMLRNYEVSFTVYLDDAKTQTNSNLSSLTTRIAATNSFEAQAMIEAQYGGRVDVRSVIEV